MVKKIMPNIKLEKAILYIAKSKALESPNRGSIFLVRYAKTHPIMINNISKIACVTKKAEVLCLQTRFFRGFSKDKLLVSQTAVEGSTYVKVTRMTL